MKRQCMGSTSAGSMQRGPVAVTQAQVDPQQAGNPDHNHPTNWMLLTEPVPQVDPQQDRLPWSVPPVFVLELVEQDGGCQGGRMWESLVAEGMRRGWGWSWWSRMGVSCRMQAPAPEAPPSHRAPRSPARKDVLRRPSLTNQPSTFAPAVCAQAAPRSAPLSRRWRRWCGVCWMAWSWQRRGCPAWAPT